MEPQRHTVLIVDDNPTNLAVLMEYLESAGFHVLVAKNGESALKRARYAQPDIILLDVMMPDLNGFETCHHLKADETTADIPVIFITALADTADKVRGFEAGGVDYITKPFQQEEVLARVRTHLTIRDLQKQLLAQIAHRDELIAELDAFAHTVAHDLKNPLGNVIGFTYLLEDDDRIGDEERRNIVQSIHSSAQKAVNIIEELLLLASVRKQEVPLEQLDMAAITDEALRQLEHMIIQHQAEIVIPDRPEDWDAAVGYAPWVEEIWINYISNAIKYGGSPPRVGLGSAPPQKGYVRFWVRDNGRGLTPEEQAQLFVPFTRLNNLRIEGHGLGLSIVRRIVEKLGGQAGVESQVGKGSIFYFTLPAADGVEK